MIKTALARFILLIKVEDVLTENNQLLISGTELNKGRKINRIKFSGLNFGNGRGVVFYPKTNDIIMAVNLFGEYIYLTSLYDTYTGTPDNQIQIKSDEMYIVSQSFGSYVKFTSEDNIVIHTNNGAKYKLLKSGGWKLYSKDGYGIECSDDGEVLIRDKTGTEVGYTNSPGTF